MRVFGRALLVAATLVGSSAVVSVAAAADEPLRGGGVQVVAPDGWGRVDVAGDDATTDPRTLLVVGTKGARPIATSCQVASYRVPADGAVVVVIGWRGSFGGNSASVGSLKLRRPTFECFAGRGAAAQVTRGGRDYQVNVMVGDRADADTVAQALSVGHSFALVPKK